MLRVFRSDHNLSASDVNVLREYIIKSTSTSFNFQHTKNNDESGIQPQPSNNGHCLQVQSMTQLVKWCFTHKSHGNCVTFAIDGI